MSNYVDPRDMHRQQETDTAPTVIDVRSESEFAAEHIPGAIHIPGNEIGDRLDEIPRGRPVVTY